MPLRLSLSSLCFSALLAVPILALAAPKYSVTVVGVAGSRGVHTAPPLEVLRSAD